MSRRAYPAVYDPYSTGTASAASKKRKQTVGIPQGQTTRTTEKTTVPKPGNSVPTNRQLYREAVEARGGNSQSPAVKTPVTLADRTARGRVQNGAAQQNRRTKAVRPDTVQGGGYSGAAGKPYGSRASAADIDAMNEIMGTSPYTGDPEDVARDFWRENGVSSAAEYQQQYFAEQEKRKRQREKEEQERKMREMIEEGERRREEVQRAKEQYEENQRRREERRERWDGFGDQFQEILKTGGSAIEGEWNGLWNYMTGKDWKPYWEEAAQKERESITETVNFLRDPFAALGNFMDGKAAPSDGEYLQKWGQRGALVRDILSDPMSYIANYVTGEAAVTDNENLQLAAEYGRRNNMLNYGRYYSDMQAAGVLGAIGSVFGTGEDSWLEQSRRDLTEEARENYDRIIKSVPPFARGTAEERIKAADFLTDRLLGIFGGIPPEASFCTREYGKAKDEAERNGYSSEAQTSYAVNKALQKYFSSLGSDYDLSENDRGFLEKFGEYVSGQREILDVFENADEGNLLDLIESLLLFVKPGADRVLNGTEEPDEREIPELFDDMVASLLDRTEERAEQWEKEAWEPREDVPDTVWGLPEFDDEYHAEEGTLLPSIRESSGGEAENFPEASEKAGKAEENWYNETEEVIELPPQGPLPPNMTYQAGEFGYTYQTDSRGRLSEWHAEDLQLTDRTGRLPYVRSTPGKLPGDHAGHVAADRFGGSGQRDNMVSQHWLVNLSSYKKLENKWSRAIRDGKKVDVKVEIKYQGDDLRPSEFIIEYTIDGEQKTKRITNDFWGGLS